MHEVYLKQALLLAKQRRGFCAPNPAVGAVVVQQGRVIGQGNHFAVGCPHAEVEAINSCQESPVGAMLYVTLEPCSHHGRTPPCIDAIAQAGIKEVVYGYADPNPKAAGGGKHFLQVSLPEIDDFYQSYAYWVRTKRPWVTAKLAMNVDGSIATIEGKPLQITGPELQVFTHQQRLHSDALLTTVKTVLADNPRLNARLEEQVISKPVYVLDRRLRFPLNAQLLKTAMSLTLFYDENASTDRLQDLQQAGLRCIKVNSDAEGLDLAEAIAAIGADGMHDLWVEAGGRCFQALLEAGLTNAGWLYLGGRELHLSGLPAFDDTSCLANIDLLGWRVCGGDLVTEFIARAESSGADVSKIP